ncbi:MAG: amidohydrolase family protein [Planctomycetaceae bacterium]|nr:amidohydrolase family protein [Planctomycetaceae bacterium]
MKIIDFHTHAFADAIADKAMAHLQAGCPGAKAFLDGRLSSLIASMDRAGIEKSVLCSIATKPTQFEPIFKWSRQIRSARIEPLPSVHPADPQAIEQVYRIAEAGFKGIKLHPYYQDFNIDNPDLDAFYEAVCRTQLLLTVHTGFDIAFERAEKASPQQIRNVLERFGDLRLITTHFGGWEQWDQVEKLLIGHPIYMETSWSMEFMGPERVERFMNTHPKEYLLFGTDSPWTDQSATVESYKKLDVPAKTLNAFFCDNAIRLLNE